MADSLVDLLGDADDLKQVFDKVRNLRKNIFVCEHNTPEDMEVILAKREYAIVKADPKFGVGAGTKIELIHVYGSKICYIVE